MSLGSSFRRIFMNTKTYIKRQVGYTLKTLIFVFAISIVSSSCAQTKQSTTSTKSKDRSLAKLIEAYQQTTLPGAPGSSPSTDYFFVLKWNSDITPETFFWKGKGTWLVCNVYKVESVKKDKDGNSIYNVIKTDLGDIDKGDMIQLYPISGGKYPIPQITLPNDTENTIVYKTKNTEWLTIPVHKINERPDLIMQ